MILPRWGKSFFLMNITRFRWYGSIPRRSPSLYIHCAESRKSRKSPNICSGISTVTILFNIIHLFQPTVELTILSPATGKKSSFKLLAKGNPTVSEANCIPMNKFRWSGRKIRWYRRGLDSAKSIVYLLQPIQFLLEAGVFGVTHALNIGPKESFVKGGLPLDKRKFLIYII